MPPKIDAVSQTEIADIVGLTPERIRQLVHEGLPQVMRSGRACYVPREVVRWLRDRDKEAGRREATGDGAPDEAKERARKTKAEADLKEHELAERRRAVVPVDEFNDFASGLVGGFAAVASGRLQQFERAMVAAVTAADARRLTQRMTAALMQGALDYADEMERADGDATDGTTDGDALPVAA